MIEIIEINAGFTIKMIMLLGVIVRLHRLEKVELVPTR